MHIKTSSYETLVEKGVSTKLARAIFYPEELHEDLWSVIGLCDSYCNVPDDVSEVTPLFDRNSDPIVRWIRNGEIEYVWLFHDDPNWSLVARHEQGVLAYLYRLLTEFLPDEECASFAMKIGFEHYELANNVLDYDCDSYENWASKLQ
ncbi:hypothetical protein [Photobacterium kasasachensis]|uniref:hypothetical protein n=1 Tax=Photobacterium kasasachensis TaxID=2910240 RepID=UPI003D0A96AE